MIKSITGTKDILPTEILYWQRLESIVEKIFSSFNYKEIRTPVFEETNLFVRSIGEETDIVGKEMYTFNDKSNASITLKPEMTASVARSFIEHSLGKLQPLNKFYYISPMFRQERPQAGRQRQFHQFGGEALGSASPLLDAEIIIIAFRILSSLNLKDLTIKINSLGIPSSRENYKNILRKHLDGKKNQLSEDSRKRFDKNILRIFDSKVESDQEIIKDAPVLIDFIDEESKKDFELVKALLKQSKVPFEVDTKLVRGLDYYTKTTFEIVSGKVGSQNALCGGGRYDLLIEQLGGTPTPGVGFAAGMERILLACQNEKSLNLPGEKIDLYITRVDEDLTQKVFELAVYFRQESLKAEFDYLGRSVKAQMREANKLNARFVLFVGGEEFKSKKLILKIMATGEQKEYPLEELNEIKNFIYDEIYKSYPNY
ncbi:MAG TPA: histidine--tRNA ligase [Ignavibacteriaceae bacterium]|nr:histidine--tRNA ligase [Ignavibacteriaceae bacterium]